MWHFTVSLSNFYSILSVLSGLASWLELRPAESFNPQSSPNINCGKIWGFHKTAQCSTKVIGFEFKLCITKLDPQWFRDFHVKKLQPYLHNYFKFDVRLYFRRVASASRPPAPPEGLASPRSGDPSLTLKQNRVFISRWRISIMSSVKLTTWFSFSPKF